MSVIVVFILKSCFCFGNITLSKIVGSQYVLVLQLLCLAACVLKLFVYVRVCASCVCMCGSVLLHLINTNFRVNNYFMNLFYFKKQPLGSGQGHGL